MKQATLNTLEFNKIVSLLEAEASCDGGRELCRNITPLTDIYEIDRLQTETSDALSRIFKQGNVNLSGTTDIRGSLKHLDIGGSLSANELLKIAQLLETAGRAKSYSRGERESDETDSLSSLFSALEPLSTISGDIRRCIISEEEIADDASSGLKSVRRTIRNINDKIHSQITSILNSSTMRTYLQDNVITMRGERYCIPVKAEYKSQVPGMIHDQSGSGSTVFIEPMSIVKLNNDLKEQFIQEEKEIEIILADLSAKVGEHTAEIEADYTVLVQLDFIFARASLAKKMTASKPEMNTDRRINIKRGRHPLIDSSRVIPISVPLGEDYAQLIITGPNTGGKTVSLKTVGLLTLMAQSGLHVPANDHSEFNVFDNIFADIGDEQSIEQSLSTFSAHMTNIVSILKEVNYNSLVLFDELGAGTDPTEGAALATAILSYLHERGILTMATTHYSELKVYALSTAGVENACCEFDVETLSPTYRLLIGVPGKSNAFAISSKLGLANGIIERAKEHIDEGSKSFEDLISDLEDSRATIENDKLEISQSKEEITSLRRKLEEKESNIAAKREEILREANRQAGEILREAKEFADKTIKDINKLASGKVDMKELERVRQTAGSRLNDATGKASQKTEQKKNKKNKPSDFKPGDSVRVLSLNLKGTVQTRPNDKGDIFVQMGILRSQVNISDLELIDEPDVTAPNMTKTGSGKIKMNKSASVSTELNIIGKTTDEGTSILEKYLDDAYLAHLDSVRIVHGRGTGALRDAVHKALRKCKYVKSFRLGEFGEGDTGVTIVEFK
ncbi:MAG: endonuclease MutS2 [Lachnospiraceae bacterium]|nr:endonuclease MutS2 [Lachnospiraceae bacterium]